jgi:hypothetical protein
MKGSTAVTNIGVQLEYFPFSIRDFTARIGSLGPFISLEVSLVTTTPPYSTLGPLGTNYISKYLTPTDNPLMVFLQRGYSLVSRFKCRTRYKLSPLRDLMIDLRFQYFFSNWVDGLNQILRFTKRTKPTTG